MILKKIQILKLSPGGILDQFLKMLLKITFMNPTASLSKLAKKIQNVRWSFLHWWPALIKGKDLKYTFHILQIRLNFFIENKIFSENF